MKVKGYVKTIKDNTFKHRTKNFDPNLNLDPTLQTYKSLRKSSTLKEEIKHDFKFRSKRIKSSRLSSDAHATAKE